MSHESQVVVPQSFIDLYLPPGRLKPIAPLAEIAARYEICEDLASALTERATMVLWQHGVTQQDVLQRLHQGLALADSGLNQKEALWIVRRLAELLNWHDVDEPYSAPGAR